MIYFVYRGRSTPSGGHKQIRLMVSLLNEMGRDACLLLDGVTCDNALYDVHVPVAPFSAEAARRFLGGDDVAVFPEGRLSHYLRLAAPWNCRKAIYCQNGFYALQSRVPGGYSRHGIEFVISITSAISSIYREYMGIDGNRIFNVPIWLMRSPIDDKCSTGAAPRELAVCYMPRKLAEHVWRVRAYVTEREPKVSWVEIDGVPEQEVARRFRENAIFFSSQDQEGCPLPALEAMACGCIVAGYRGTRAFTHPYATPQNGLWAPDRSIRRAAEQVLHAIRIVREGGAPLERLRASGLQTVRA